jgi:ABC-type transporter Mla MlaB component
MATGDLVLTGALTMRTSEANCAQLREAIMQEADVRIDCRGATEVDLTFVQLLVSAGVSARLVNKPISFSERPDGALLDALTRTGLHVTNIGQPDSSTTFWFEEVSV